MLAGVLGFSCLAAFGAQRDLSGLPLEDRRYLLYLYARLGDLSVAEGLAEQILSENPSDKQTLLVMASLYVEKKQAEKALRNAGELRRYFPTDDQALYFVGAAHYLAGQYLEANEVFRSLKSSQFQGRLYPYQTDLSSSAYQAKDWYRAMQAYQELLREHNLSDELRLKARAVLERIYYEHLPKLELEQNAYWLEQGRSFRSELEYRQHFTDRHRLLASLRRSDLLLEPAPGVRSYSEEFHEALLGLQSALDRRYESILYGGVSDEGPMGGASLTRHIGQQRHLRLEVTGNERALDGLLIEALNGRQDKLSLSASYLLTHEWLLYAEVHGRQVRIDQERLGQGYGATFNIEHLIFREIPDLRIGHRTAWSRFSRSSENLALVGPVASAGATAAERSAMLGNLEPERYHRHGVYTVWRDQLSGWFLYHGSLGVDYNIELSSVEYNALAGFSVYPRKSLEIRAEGGYFSSARTADQGSALWQLNCAVTYWF